MKLRGITAWVVIALAAMCPCLGQPGDSSAPVTPSKTSSPRIRFESKRFVFGRLSTNGLLHHDFVFTNLGTAPLKILSVQTGCGCTSAGAWDRQVKPGETGIIPIQFNPVGLSGEITKTVRVASNDPDEPDAALEITGTVFKPIEIRPMLTFFSLSDESTKQATHVIRIVNNLEEPITLSDLECTNSLFRTELKTVVPGREFELHVSLVPPFTVGSASTTIHLRTSSSEVPRISTVAHASILQPVTVMPECLSLSPVVVANPRIGHVNVRNNGTNALVLSDPRSNFSGATVHLKEIQPGRLFTLAAEFPVGFEIPADRQIEVTVKSNHPRFPLVRIPVVGGAVAETRPGPKP